MLTEQKLVLRGWSIIGLTASSVLNKDIKNQSYTIYTW